jgi:nitroreductase
MYDSQSEVDRVAEGYAANTTLMTALRELAAKKNGMTDPPVDLMTKFRNDLSGTEPWRIGELRYAVVRELRTPSKSAGALFQSADGSAFVLIAAPDLSSAKKRAIRLGKGARIFEVQPKWSLPTEAWVSLNPKLWKD